MTAKVTPPIRLAHLVRCLDGVGHDIWERAVVAK